MILSHSLIKESRIVQWLLNVTESNSVFGESRIFRGLSSWLGRFSLLRELSFERSLPWARWLLVGLVFASIFFPRIYLGAFGPARVDLRGEDLLLPLLLVLMGGIRLKKSLFELPQVERAFLWFLILAQVSILNGFLQGTVDKPFVSLLYFLKWVEYFLIFTVTVRLLTDMKSAGFPLTPTLSQGERGKLLGLPPFSPSADFFFKAFFILGIAVALYGWGEYFFPQVRANYPNYYRLYERFPFYGNANHIGGLLVIWILFFTGVFLNAESRREKIWILLALLFVFFPFAWTYSRKSYFALGGALALPLFFWGARRRFLFLILLFGAAALFFPTRILERLTDLWDTLTSTDPFHSSWAGNWVMWKESLWNFNQVFLFGSGFGSRHRLFYESQYVQILAETGLVGFSFFIYLCLTLFREAIGRYRPGLPPKGKGMALGWLLAFLGFLIHSLSCVSWTTTKTAIPFWFLTACVLVSLKKFEPRHG